MMGLRRGRPRSRPRTTRTCQHGTTFFAPDPRSAGRQHACATPACRKASTAASQRRGRPQPGHRDSVSGPAHVERVRQWRQAHPGSWRRQASRVPEGFQAPLAPHEPLAHQREAGCGQAACQEAFCMPPALFVGLLAPRTGLSCHEDIAVTARRRQPWGRESLGGSTHATGGIPEAHPPPRVGPTPAGPSAVQLGGSALGP